MSQTSKAEGGANPSDFQARWVELVRAYRADRLPGELQAVKARAVAAAAALSDEALQDLQAVDLLASWGVVYDAYDFFGPATIVNFVLVEERRGRKAPAL